MQLKLSKLWAMDFWIKPAKIILNSIKYVNNIMLYYTRVFPKIHVGSWKNCSVYLKLNTPVTSYTTSESCPKDRRDERRTSTTNDLPVFLWRILCIIIITCTILNSHNFKQSSDWLQWATKICVYSIRLRDTLLTDKNCVQIQKS